MVQLRLLKMYGKISITWEISISDGAKYEMHSSYDYDRFYNGSWFLNIDQVPNTSQDNDGCARFSDTVVPLNDLQDDGVALDKMFTI